MVAKREHKRWRRTAKNIVSEATRWYVINFNKKN